MRVQDERPEEQVRDQAVPVLPDTATFCGLVVRERDPDRYFASLFAPLQHRAGLFALYAFNSEIAQVRERVNEPLPGEVRLQWWRDVLTGDARGNVQANPVAAAILETMLAYNLPVQALLDIIDARTFDLYDDPMPTMGDLEGYCGETSSSLVRLASIVLADGKDPGGGSAAGHAGVAWALTGLMRSLPWHARRGQLYLPRDVLERSGVTRDDIVTGRGGPGLLAALRDLRAVTRGHLRRMRHDMEGAPRLVMPGFLPVMLVEPYLRRMERPGYDPLNDVIDLPLWRKQVILWWASRKRPGA